ncbi:MAG: hypothetical protein R6W70_00175 [bacterium]
MKRKTIFSMFFLAFFLTASCAQQMTVREREMKKYQEIDMSIVAGMPAPVVETVEAYNNGDYSTAAMGFYAIKSNNEWSRLHETARYYYAESLFRMGLYQAAEYELAEMLFRGPETHYFMSSLLKLLAVTYKTENQNVLFAVLANVDYSQLPDRFANELTYYLGKVNFYEGKDKDAVDFFSKVKDYSSHYPSATYFLGVLNVKMQKYAEAMKKFEEILNMPTDKYLGADIKKLKDMSELAMGQLYYAAAWKSENPLAMFNVSLNYFANVGSDNEQWFESLFARTWASLMISRFDATMGTIVTLRSPFFEDVYYPEINIVQAVTYYNLCQYEMVNRVVEDFFEIYPEYRDEVEKFIEDVSTKTGLEIYEEMLLMNRDLSEGKEVEIPASILTTMLRDPLFKKQFNHIKEIERELDLIKNSPDNFKNSSIAEEIEKKLRIQLATLRNEAGRWLVNRMHKIKQDLTSLIAQMKGIQFEMTDQLKKQQRKEEMYGKEVSEQTEEDEKISVFNPSTPQDSYYYKFDGEYWKDELGYYFYSIENQCK